MNMKVKVIMSKYKQATFQPTIRPSWAGTLPYIDDKEKADILMAIINFPNDTDIESVFWEQTIKPDLKLQYEKFLSTCQARSQVARTYWGEQKDNNCITKVSKTKDKDKDKDKNKNQDKDKDKEKDNTEKETESYDNIYQTSAYNFVKAFGGVGSAYKDEVCIDNDFNLFQLDHPQTKQMIELYGDGLAYDIQKWIRRKFYGKRIGKRFIIEQFAKFYERNKK